MSKLTKFFKHPVLFFRDSKLFGKPDVSSVKECENLFFIANLGQLEQIQALIKYEKLNGCFVCILYTPANKNMPKVIVDNIDHELINGHYLAKLPVSPNRIHIENLIYMQRLYSRIIGKSKPNNIFLLSFEVHYALIASIANNNRVSLSLVEEGTGTYKFNDSGVNLAPVMKRDKFKKQIFLIRYLPLFANIRPALETARNFDHIYAAFPHLLQNAFNYKTMTRFLLHAPGGKKLDASSLKVIQKYCIASSDIIFVSQRYAVEPELFFNSLFDFLNELSILTGSRILIKLHPKESSLSLKVARNKLDFLGGKSNLVLITENAFLIEPTIAYVKPKAVVGIASTSLAYTSLVSPSTLAISLGDYLVGDLIKRNSVKKDEVAIINSHVAILKKFENVCFVNSSNMAAEFISENISSSKFEISIDEDLVRSAQKYFSEGKYWKAHCYYEWSVKGAVELFSFETFKNYYINLIFLKDEDLVVHHLPCFTEKLTGSRQGLEPRDQKNLYNELFRILDAKIVAKDKRAAVRIFDQLTIGKFFDRPSSLLLRKVFINLAFGDLEVAAVLLKEYLLIDTLQNKDLISLYYLLYSDNNISSSEQVVASFDNLLKPYSSLSFYERALINSYKESNFVVHEKSEVGFYFNEFDANLNKKYKAKFVSNDQSNSLTVVFQESIFPIRKIEKQSNVLYISDFKNTFFTFNPVSQSAHLKTFIEKCNFSRVVYTGDGLGGFGAMLWSTALNRSYVHCQHRCVVLNPLVDVSHLIIQKYGLNDVNATETGVSQSMFKNFNKYSKIINQKLINLPPTLVVDSFSNFDLKGFFCDDYNVKVVFPSNGDIANLEEFYELEKVLLGDKQIKPLLFITKF